MTNISLVIPTYNKLPRLSLVLASLTRQTYPTDKWEVVVADDGSSDSTSDHLRHLDVPFSLRCLSAPRAGRSAARNRGFKHATFDVVLFIDDDVLLPPEFLVQHATLQAQEPAVVHGKIVTVSELKFFQDPSNGVFYPELERTAARSSVLRAACLTARDVLDDFDRSVRRHTRTTAFESIVESVLTGRAEGPRWLGFTGGNVAAPRAWIEAAGGFDESFGLAWGSEDIELGYRLWRVGRRFRYSAECVNYHLAHHRFAYDTEQRQTSTYFLEKHPDPDVAAMVQFIAGTLDREELLERFRANRGGSRPEHRPSAEA